MPTALDSMLSLLIYNRYGQLVIGTRKAQILESYSTSSLQNPYPSSQHQGSVLLGGMVGKTDDGEWMRSDGRNNFLVWHDSRRVNFSRKFQSNRPKDIKHGKNN
jgi:hypothetical protein